jgi:hypothetical protein
MATARYHATMIAPNRFTAARLRDADRRMDMKAGRFPDLTR